MQGLGTASFLHILECDTALPLLTVGLVLQALRVLLLIALMSQIFNLQNIIL